MTRPARITLICAGSFVALLAIAAGIGVGVLRSGWLRGEIRNHVIAEAEKATGGKVDIGALQIDWKTLTAQIDDLVIHGTEPAGAAPLLAVKRVVIGFRVLSFIERRFDVARVEGENPRANVMIGADGATNLPHPKLPKGSNGSETILALKIRKFDLANGAITIERAGKARATTPWNARGENLTAHVSYDPRGPRYEGDVSLTPTDFAWDGVRASAQLSAKASLQANRLTIAEGTFRTGQSEIVVRNLLLDGFASPVTTGEYSAHVSLADADRIFHFVNFQHSGNVTVSGKLRFVSAADYLVTGVVRGAGIGYGPVRDMGVSGNISATPGKVLVKDLIVNALGGRLRGEGEVRRLEDFHLAGTAEHLDARALAMLGGVAALPYDGMLSGPFDASGKLSEPGFHHLMAGATLDVSPAEGALPVHGTIAAKYDGETGAVELGRSWIELAQTRVDAAGIPGQRLDVEFHSHDLSDLQPVLGKLKLPAKIEANGAVDFKGTITGALRDPKIAGHVTARNAGWKGQRVDSLAGDFTAMKSEVTMRSMTVSARDLHMQVTGSAGLSNWKTAESSAVNANVRITDADATKLLTMAGESEIRVTGTLNTTAQVTGTIGDPHAIADLTLTRGAMYGEPFDRVTGHAQYVNSGAQLLSAVVDAGKKRLTVSLRFDHPNKVTLTASSNVLALGDVALLRKEEPEIKGTAQFKADGVIETRGNGHFEIVDVSGDIHAAGLALGARMLGDAEVTAETKNGVMTARFNSNAARAAIHGDGTVRLADDYPVNAKLTFSNLSLSAVAAAIRGPIGDTNDLNLDGAAAGEVSLSGSARTPDLLTATIDVTQFEMHPLTVTGGAKNIPDLAVRNDGPLRATLAKSVVRIESAKFRAPETNLQMSGTIAPRAQLPFDLQINGTMNLALAQTYNTDLMSSGELLVNAGVRGSFASPDISGRAEIQKAEFHYADFSNGLTNTNGVIVFNGRRATIQSLNAESGGGKVDANGFVTLTNGSLAFRFEAKTRNVRVRYPAGVSTVSDSDITLAGTSARSEASGKVSVRRVSINPKSDMTAILAGAAQPMKTAAGNTGFLGNMNLDVQIETAPDVVFETSVAQSLEADANLRLRGTAAAPAVLGRINVTQGEMAFFGNKYTINQGSISFFNPARIDPVLNVDLQTKARGVDVTITVSGSISNLHASYRSDPPLQFADIVALLATGRSPTETTVATQNTGQSQNLQQLGASALLGEAISNGVGGPLQRFFGVSKVKLDPQLTGITGSPEARLTVEQQVSPEILFTYITDVSSTSTQLVRVEWDFSRKWAAIVTREENGYVGVDFAFKKRFK